MATKNPQEVWRTTLAQIEVKLDSPAQYKTFFQGATLVDIEHGKAIISVPNPYTSDWLRQKHEVLIKDTIAHVYGQELKLEFIVNQQIQDHKVEQKVLEMESPLLSASSIGVHSSVTDAINIAGLNQRYAMGNYVVADSNRIAHAAAVAVVENLGKTYNPLFIYGKTGVGKTHLAQAIGRAIIERNPARKVVYTSSEGFLNDLIKAIRSNKTAQIRSRYRSINLLIIDDIQLISKWVKTQEEFFNTFNDLHNHNNQIILISDRKPEEIKELEARLRTRFQGGMVVEIGQSDYEMRLAILQQKSESSGMDLTPRILETIASGVSDNLRELEGALQKVALFNQMKSAGDLSIEEVQRIIGTDTRSKRDRVKVPVVLRAISKSFGVSVKDIKGERRTKDVAFARQVAMYILREELGYKLEDVAHALNRTDHTTVMHGVDRIKSQILTTEGFKHQLVSLIQDLAEKNEDEF